ncbi:hypothetical protein F5B22DRAFT_609031 [Xylaria bambusicola]|uniref:uncharacterized protein n=1 Tax=Xylaria bambusicola TaxID=326684 RepID=UPI002008B52E|nr:uncharacterized protein F5B22DRAFT_609031 [Xylaria bambusicola]KAI0514928.1 hypothetical protein F5B22DRAFT_609031 [Xylaria bambusicola]
MPRKVMIFVGAPEAQALDWTESNLLNHFLQPFASFVHLKALPESSLRETSFLSTPDTAVWRSLPLHKERLPTGFSQTHALAHVYQGSPEFFTTLTRSFDTTSDLSEDVLDQDIADRFYDHSVAIHGDIPSSQLPATSFATEDSSFEVTGDFTEETSTQPDDTTLLRSFQQEDVVTHLSDLEDLPDAKYLQSILPQTMTVNLIVGIISIAEPRTVRTRWGGTKSLVELLVADETRSGFSVTFWMSSEPSETNQLVCSLRRQDIILLRNVALSVFMKKVHGRSLRKGHTKIDLLHRRRIDKDDTGGMYTMKDVASTRRAHPQLAKTRKVWQWLSHFVGDGGTSLGKRRHNGKPIRRWNLPPADTQ